MNSVHEKAKRGIKLIMARQVIVQAVTFGGGVILARILSPSQFGLYAIATFLVQAFALFGSFGLAPSLIQRKKELADEDLQVGFTLQQVCTTVVVGGLLIGAPWLVSLYPKSSSDSAGQISQAIWLVRALAFSLYLTSWRTMSALQLERHLKYNRLAAIEVIEILSYQTIAVVLALMHYGVWSFVWATLARGILGTVLVYAAAPWTVKLKFDVPASIHLLRFAIPFQICALINNLSSWITPTLVAGMIGPQAVGYLTWANSNGKKPLMIVENVMRVSFPHFARIQDDQQEVERLITRYVTGLLLLSGIWFALLYAAGPALVGWIYTAKWTPAVPALILSALAVALDVIIWVVSVTMNATGKVKMAANRALLRTVLNIGLALPLIKIMGFIGVPISYLIAGTITLPCIFTGFPAGTMSRMLRSIAWTAAPAAAAAFAGRAAASVTSIHVVQALMGCAAACIVFAAVAWLLSPDWVQSKVRNKLPAVLRRQAVAS